MVMKANICSSLVNVVIRPAHKTQLAYLCDGLFSHWEFIKSPTFSSTYSCRHFFLSSSPFPPPPPSSPSSSSSLLLLSPPLPPPHRVEEVLLKKIVWQTLQAVSYCHQHGVRVSTYTIHLTDLSIEGSCLGQDSLTFLLPPSSSHPHSLTPSHPHR